MFLYPTYQQFSLSGSTPAPKTDTVFHTIKTQIEYYFSEKNLYRDILLLRKITQNKQRCKYTQRYMPTPSAHIPFAYHYLLIWCVSNYISWAYTLQKKSLGPPIFRACFNVAIDAFADKRVCLILSLSSCHAHKLIYLRLRFLGVSLSFLATFPRIKDLTSDLNLVACALQTSTKLEVRVMMMTMYD